MGNTINIRKIRGELCINDNNEKKIELLKEIFDDGFFNAFNFSGCFRLSFERNKYIQDVKYPIPNRFDLVIMADWRFGSESEWQSLKDKFDLRGLVEEDEPVHAFELVKLRWSEGADVSHINFFEDTFEIHFANNQKIVLNNYVECDNSWFIDTNDFEYKGHKFIICKEGNIYISDNI